MTSSIATRLLRRTARPPLTSALFASHCPAFSSSPPASPLSSYPRFSNFLIQNIAVAAPAVLHFPRFASTRVEADENLESVLQSEIECAKDSEDHGREIDAPEGFPFEIIDNSGDQTIILKRKFAGENIQATVFVNFDGEDMSNDDEDNSEVDNHENAVATNISLVVAIDKGEGPVLEISCNIGSSDLEIESVAMKSIHDSDVQGAYQGPEFSDLDESLQKALHKYLKARGIDSSLRDFLHAYMMSKDEREYHTWLENMKEFVGK